MTGLFIWINLTALSRTYFILLDSTPTLPGYGDQSIRFIDVSKHVPVNLLNHVESPDLTTITTSDITLFYP